MGIHMDFNIANEKAKSLAQRCDGMLDWFLLVDLLNYFLFQPVLCNWYNKGMVCIIHSLWWCL